MTNTKTDNLMETTGASQRDFDLPRGSEIVDINTSVDGIVIPIVEEQIEIGTRQVETGRVRITKTVHTHEETIDEPILQEQVSVERVAVGREVSEPPAVRYEGDTMIVPVMEERVVVTTQLVLREELRITRVRTETREPQTVTLRSEEVAIERITSRDLDGTLESSS